MAASATDADVDLAERLARVEALARRLDREPDLRDIVDIWPLLGEHVRQAIVTLVRGGGASAEDR